RLTKLARSAVMDEVPAGTRVPTRFNMGSSNREGMGPPFLPPARPPAEGGRAGSPLRRVRRSIHADPVHAGPGVAEEHGDSGLLEHVSEDETVAQDEAVAEHEPVPQDEPVPENEAVAQDEPVAQEEAGGEQQRARAQRPPPAGHPP